MNFGAVISSTRCCYPLFCQCRYEAYSPLLFSLCHLVAHLCPVQCAVLPPIYIFSCSVVWVYHLAGSASIWSFRFGCCPLCNTLLMQWLLWLFLIATSELRSYSTTTQGLRDTKARFEWLSRWKCSSTNVWVALSSKRFSESVRQTL